MVSNLHIKDSAGVLIQYRLQVQAFWSCTEKQLAPGLVSWEERQETHASSSEGNKALHIETALQLKYYPKFHPIFNSLIAFCQHCTVLSTIPFCGLRS